MLVAWPVAEARAGFRPNAEGGDHARNAPPANPTRANLLRGEYGPYRANNDLLYYHLDVRVDPVKQQISGKNTIRFRMLKDDDQDPARPACRNSVSTRSSTATLLSSSSGNRVPSSSDFPENVEGGPGLFH